MATRITGRLLSEPQLRGADLEMFWEYLSQHGILAQTELERRFTTGSTTLLTSTLDFLCDLTLAETQVSDGEQHYRAVDTAAFPSFRLRLLKGLWAQRDHDASFHAIFEYFIRKNIPGFLHTRSKLKVVQEIQREVHMELAFTGEKMETWTHLATYIGLIRLLNSESINYLCAPSPELVGDLLVYLGGGKRDIVLADWVEAVETQFCPIMTNERQLHAGLGQTLLAMETMGMLRIPPPPADMARFRLSETRSAAIVELGGTNHGS